MLVDIILPTYRGKRFVVFAIESVIEQSYPDWRLVIVDDSSGDGTLELVQRRYSAHPQIEVIPLTARTRTPGARMRAISCVDGDAVAFIDQDDVWDPHKLARQVTVMQHTATHMVHSDCWHIDGYGYKIPHAARRENSRRARIDYQSPAKVLVPELYRASSIRLVSALIDRAAFDEVGGFDTINFGVEEWEFWIRFAARGYKMFHLPAPLFAHRDHANNASKVYALERLRNVLHMAEIIAKDYGITGMIVQRTKIWALRNIVITGLLQGRAGEVQEEIDALLRAGQMWAYALRVLSMLPGYRVISNAGVKAVLRFNPLYGG